ncbi:MAG: hypothetical protein C7B46_08250 [Sulfobacillus benefaciens]|uniref:Uncharacterized protein n=1 Tax=Sulfobacillus benefaciens TaxID=453960 RepID=A0A2T2XH72_9FIRM|nr:MAG: hypothetical protein C7B46_08250 [Sulfobacillus benefaciens]
MVAEFMAEDGQVKTSACSLSEEARADDKSGDDGYQYCRGLARKARFGRLYSGWCLGRLEEAMLSEDIFDKVVASWPVHRWAQV